MVGGERLSLATTRHSGEREQGFLWFLRGRHERVVGPPNSSAAGGGDQLDGGGAASVGESGGGPFSSELLGAADDDAAFDGGALRGLRGRQQVKTRVGSRSPRSVARPAHIVSATRVGMRVRGRLINSAWKEPDSSALVLSLYRA